MVQGTATPTRTAILHQFGSRKHPTCDECMGCATDNWLKTVDYALACRTPVAGQLAKLTSSTSDGTDTRKREKRGTVDVICFVRLALPSREPRVLEHRLLRLRRQNAVVSYWYLRDATESERCLSALIYTWTASHCMELFQMTKRQPRWHLLTIN